MLSFFRANAIALASLVVAATSVFVAVVSLRYSVHSQQEDAFYKELLIKPQLQIAADSVHYEIRLENVGLGPAEIRRIVFSDGKNCLDTETVHDWNGASAFFENFSDALRSYILRDLPAAIDKKSAPIPVPYVPVPSPGVLVKAGDKYTVISFELKDINAYLAFLAKYDADAPNEFEDHFIQRGMAVPLYVYYCSVSGRYCTATSNEDLLDCTRRNSNSIP